MRLEGSRESENVEDRRGMKPAVMAGGGLITLVIMLVGMFLGVDPQLLKGLIQQVAPPPGAQAGPLPGQPGGPEPIDDESIRFVKKVLAETEDVWSEIFASMGKTYKQPKLVVYRGSTPSACGVGEAAMGPFYCPGDHFACFSSQT